jgi:Flp pilus assembly protein TadG
MDLEEEATSLRLFTDERGNALIEFAVTAPLLVALFVSTMTFAVIIQQNIALTDAAAAGAKYGINGHLTDFVGMISAATNEAGGVSGFSASASTYCSCTPGGAAVSCASGTCSTPVEYLKVTTNASVPVLFIIPQLPAKVTLSATSSLRIPWAGY